ncbi:MAG: hypothetical protein JJE25_07400 [Bacteroidia bacterium]|nr:hypothetical protein [Bacteroidia bacterium]
MATKRRIPRKDSVFDSYIGNTTTHLLEGTPQNGIRLGLTADEINSWNDFATGWKDAYPLYTNLSTRTRTIKDEKNRIKKEFKTFATPLLMRMRANAALTVSDRNALNLPVRSDTYTHRGKIGSAPFASTLSGAGSRIKIRTRVEGDASRASRHPLADAIEMRWQVGGAAPANPDACPGTVFSKRALFTFEAGIENDGKKFWCFCRYVNLSNPANNGPWGARLAATVQG